MRDLSNGMHEPEGVSELELWEYALRLATKSNARGADAEDVASNAIAVIVKKYSSLPLEEKRRVLPEIVSRTVLADRRMRRRVRTESAFGRPTQPDSDATDRAIANVPEIGRSPSSAVASEERRSQIGDGLELLSDVERDAYLNWSADPRPTREAMAEHFRCDVKTITARLQRAKARLLIVRLLVGGTGEDVILAHADVLKAFPRSDKVLLRTFIDRARHFIRERVSAGESSRGC